MQWKVLICFFITYLLSAHYGLAQTPSHTCGTEAHHQEMLKKNADYAKNQRQLDHSIYKSMLKLYQERAQGRGYDKSGATYTIPVVVHIIHNGGSENISDAQVQKGIEHLNLAFRHLAPYNGAKGVDVDIAFCLAKQDELGNPTNGITRTVSALTDLNSANDLTMKNLSRWDTKKYLNIWLVKEICMPSYGCGVAGYAYYASAHGTSFDGVVNEARWFGSSFDGSKIHIHEVGHYLNLAHTFDGGCVNNNCLLNGDRVCDTPPDDSKAAIGCASTTNTCTTDVDDTSINNPFRPIGLGGLGDQPDMIENYMDYGFQSCQNAFTQGQKDRMVAALTGVRASLLGSLGCTDPCTTPIQLIVNQSPLNPVNVGSLVNFANTSTGATNFEWFINNVSQTNTTNFSHTFAAAGLYQVKLIAQNGNISCQKDTTLTVQVVCPSILVGFTPSASNVVAGTTVSFNNTTTGADAYQWFLNDVFQNNTTHYNHTFNTQGIYEVKLLATNTLTGCSYADSTYITVTCPVKAYFTSSANDIFQNTVVNFTNTSLNAGSYQWLIDNVLVSTITNFSQNFNTLGDYVVSLVADNGICRDTVSQIINVSNPAQCTQKQANIWFFGLRAGLDFTSGTATPRYDGQMYAPEGCASITNEFGNLLFYTNGEQVWNRNHSLMPNGTGLLGDVSSTQSAQIVPKPGNPSIYYIFTTDKEGGTNGLRYSEVDMSLNTGFGDITANKNILLQTPVDEKLTATLHANNCDVWLITHGIGNNEFYAYLITSNGISTPPVTSSVGTSYGSADAGTQGTFGGQLKASPDGAKLAMAIRNAKGVNPNVGSIDVFELYDFNNTTGVVSNALTLATSQGSSSNPDGISAPYGVEFSPDNSRVYVSSVRDRIYQFNLLAGSNAAIIASRIAISTAALQSGYYALQLAPDQKIYVAQGFGANLGIIQNPNNLGSACNYIHNGIYIGNPTGGSNEVGIGLQGLPGFIPNGLQKLDFEYQCEGTVMHFKIKTSVSNIQNLVWDFGHPISGADNTSNLYNPSHNYQSDSGPFNVNLQVKDKCLCVSITKSVSFPPNCLTALPMNWLKFVAQEHANAVRLHWEVNSFGFYTSFDLQRSQNGLDFESINHTQFIDNQGVYEFLDQNISVKNGQKIYYRLKMKDLQNKIHFSEIQSIIWQHRQYLKIYPQPIHNQGLMKIQLPEDASFNQGELFLYDALGKLTWQTAYRQSGILEIPLPPLPQGVYLLKINTLENIYFQKIMITNE
ncbi:MAG: M43 family zinc metalloprotease [Microscillaceae bacterium]|jgi:PKD repeat protein|nr:M43 family zinc metalloprotease [Microscillaceae bacterium]